MKNFFKIVDLIVKGTVFALFSIIIILVVVQVFMRYILRSPFIWLNELVQFLLIWGTLLGCGLAISQNKHIKLDLLLQKFSLKWNYIFQLLELFLLLILASFYLIIGSHIALDARNTYLSSLHVTKMLYFGAIPVSALIWLFYIISNGMQLIGNLKNEKNGGKQ